MRAGTRNLRRLVLDVVVPFNLREDCAPESSLFFSLDAPIVLRSKEREMISFPPLFQTRRLVSIASPIQAKQNPCFQRKRERHCTLSRVLQ